MVWGAIKRAKDLWTWVNFIWHIVGWFGLTTAVSGIGVTIIGVVGAMIKGLPWPFVLMAAYCTLVGVAYLVALSIFIPRLQNGSVAPSKSAKRAPVRPHYEAWKHVERFTLSDAAYLWNDLEPHSDGTYTEVNAWIDAFCGEIRKGALEFIPNVSSEYYGSRRDEIIEYQRANPDSETKVGRNHLVDFAQKYNYHIKFLEV
jgi:hypothetical protein